MKLFSLANEEKVFVKKESPEGTLAYPTSANTVLVTGASALAQDIEFIDDAQLRSSRSKLSPIKGRTRPGEWSLTTYCKPSGTLGVAPEADPLFECLMGKKTTPSGVLYGLDSSVNLGSCSIWVKKGHSVFALEGCTVNTATFNIAGGEIVSISWAGQFMKWYRGGSDQAQTAVTAAETHVHVHDAKRFTPKMKISIGADTKTGVGYTISTVDYAGNILNISDVGGFVTGCALNAEVAGFVPTVTEVGTPVHGKITQVTVGSLLATLISAQVVITNNIKYYEDEMNGQWYPTAYGTTGFRNIEGTMGLYFRKPTMQYFYKSEYQLQDALVIQCGELAGKRMKINMPKIEYRTPKISGDEEVMVEIPYVAVASASLDDEVNINFD